MILSVMNSFTNVINYARHLLGGWTVEVSDEDTGSTIMHRATSRQDAIDWLKQYPANWGGVITVYKRRKFVCARV